jgi:putative acetyltransferase
VENPEAIVKGGGQLFFVLEEGRVAGTCAALRCGEGVYEIAKMAVSEESRGRGYGDLLMQASLEWIANQSAREVVILSNTVLKPAIGLYRKFGFEVERLGPHPDYVRCNIEMRLKLG